MEIQAAGAYTSNAELIEALRDLGYLRKEWRTLDPTFGEGVFWQNWRPETLIATDLDVTKSPAGVVVDFTNMPFKLATFDAVVFDPPYRLNGQPDLGEFDHRYGIGKYTKWQDRMQLCIDGITECVSMLKKGGYLLVKCQDQVCSGKKRWQTREFSAHAESLGCELVDMMHILTTPRKQPAGRRQVHSRQNYSTMLCLRKKV